MNKALYKSWIIFLFLVIWAWGCGVEREREEMGEPEEVVSIEKKWGDAPDFTLPDLEGNSLTLSDFKGKVIILNFWATWCPPCREEIPDFVELYEEYKDEGLVIIGVNLDRGDSRTVKQFSKNYKINYPIVTGNVSVTQDYGGIRGIPTTFIIDRKGNIKEKYLGYRSKATFEEAVKRLL
ncbi:redoxin domain-containing protein [bacterium]|nr:redoxin domain-containing protein [bacterium]NIN92073.1 redoxin domain-containing protein [bacterium]NIO18286.1 redoxin domain-containing protein [bacterium]NIO73260.1 redoxin domain-containing protein [bacterium]